MYNIELLFVLLVFMLRIIAFIGMKTDNVFERRKVKKRIQDRRGDVDGREEEMIHTVLSTNVVMIMPRLSECQLATNRQLRF
jgi:hypothetical protein